MSRFMALAFAVHTSRGRAKRSTFKAKLNVDLRRSQNGEAATSYRALLQNPSAREKFARNVSEDLRSSSPSSYGLCQIKFGLMQQSPITVLDRLARAHTRSTLPRDWDQ